jgi:hypothetical protein
MIAIGREFRLLRTEIWSSPRLSLLVGAIGSRGDYPSGGTSTPNVVLRVCSGASSRGVAEDTRRGFSGRSGGFAGEGGQP